MVSVFLHFLSAIDEVLFVGDWALGYVSTQN